MSLFGLMKKNRSRSRKNRVSRRSKSKRVGNRINIVKRGRSKSFKIKKNKDGREYYMSGKKKTKHFLSKKKRHSKRSRKFGSGGLINIMGNFNPPAQMSLAQSTTGMSAPQMFGHMKGVPLSLRSNFYTNIR